LLSRDSYLKLYFIDVSGDNVASFFVKKNGTVIRTRRSWWAQGTDNMIQFSLGPNDGIIFDAGDVVSLTVIHNRTGVGSFGAALVVLLGKVGIRIKNTLGSRRAFMCTELIGEWLNEFIARSGVCIPALDSSTITPVTIELLLGANSDLFQVVE